MYRTKKSLKEQKKLNKIMNVQGSLTPAFCVETS